MTFLEMVNDTLIKAKIPLSANEIWEKGLEFGFAQKVMTKGLTPGNTISAQLYVDIKDNSHSKFCIASKRPTKFALNSWGKVITDILEVPVLPKKEILKYLEKDLHRVLTYFAYNYMDVLTKTINDKYKKAAAKGKNEWMHPDLVGIDISPIKGLSKGVLSFSKQINQTPSSIYSFELKRKIGFSNLRESYFQAVSNSRWANKGYLVFAEIEMDDTELIIELERLSLAYGIGLIKIDINNPDESKILFEAKTNETLEWSFINYLFEMNSDYKTFIDASVDIMKTETIYKEKFDYIATQDEIQKYVAGFKTSYS